MKKLVTFVALLSMGAACTAWAESDRQESMDRLDHAGRVLHEVMAAPDSGIPQEVLEHAKCIAVVPHMIKGGFVFGAEGGRGVTTCRTDKGWSAPAFFAITGGSWGLQIGIEGVDLVKDHDVSLHAIAHAGRSHRASDADDELQISGVGFCAISIDERLVVAIARHEDVSVNSQHRQNPAELPD